ncbi:3'-5' exoribonuclease YhaM family protein [Halalkalibacter krulwichiae]|uniref:3'-5' exoribonuclease YhaM n=1 Tax=Halalkalibacter krulwichiae TaxID=199441 RepID=A0A1X9MLJ6_9BACI|nr:3'-5' exoribonuclease YhaM family protein [Halalkalibacter krulwichiae]ARK31722.1 3'-5' exoribonuclease YhaM [Halalkalibacter krulwichiae]
MASWQERDTITDFFLIKEREIKQASNGSEYANFTIEKNLHVILARLWDITDDQKRLFIRKSIVKIEGTVITYRGQVQLNINRMRLATDDDAINVSQLISKDGVNREELWHELRLMMEEVHSETLRSIIKNVFSQKLLRERLTTIPASKNYHHPYYAGLLDHIVHVSRAALQLLPLYPQVNRDIIMSACLLHDLGKTELFTEPVAPDYSTSGHLMGHIVLGLEIIHDAAREAGIPSHNEELMSVKHCIASQFGEVSQGYGSTVSPKTAEAIFFQHIKQMNTMLHAFEMIQERAKDEWTYSPMFKRKMYTGKEGSK